MDELEKVSAFQIDDVTALKYLKDVTQILAEYSWVYNVRNTDIFLHHVLEIIPTCWCEALNDLPNEDFCQLPFNLLKNEWPSSLSSFVNECHRLGNFRFPANNLQDVMKHRDKLDYVPKKMASKKQFEVQIMAYLINQVCQDVDCYSVLDIGSGLGYLDQVLHHSFNFNCIGLDSSVKYTKAANDRIKKDSCRNAMHHKTLEVAYSEKCLGDLKSILNDNLNFECSCSLSEKATDSFAMVGLHCCGNLTQDMMKLFSQMNEIVALVCVGCCYNKINLADFPMSKTALGALKDTFINYPEWRPCTSGLRLAAHGTRSHSTYLLMDPYALKSLFYRSLIEFYVKKENIAWKHPKRHIRSADLSDFATYCKKMFINHPLGNDETTFKNLTNLLDEKMHLFPRVRTLLMLQMLLQPLWEGFIAVDRILYFREKSMHANVLALWDDAKSSRNLALCVYKKRK